MQPINLQMFRHYYCQEAACLQRIDADRWQIKPCNKEQIIDRPKYLVCE